MENSDSDFDQKYSNYYSVHQNGMPVTQNIDYLRDQESYEEYFHIAQRAQCFIDSIY